MDVTTTSATSLQLLGIQCFPQGYFSSADTCHNKDSLKGCQLMTAIHQKNVIKLENETSNCCCQTVPQANVSVFTAIGGLCFVFSDTPQLMGGALVVLNMKHEEALHLGCRPVRSCSVKIQIPS